MSTGTRERRRALTDVTTDEEIAGALESPAIRRQVGVGRAGQRFSARERVGPAPPLTTLHRGGSTRAMANPMAHSGEPVAEGSDEGLLASGTSLQDAESVEWDRMESAAGRAVEQQPIPYTVFTMLEAQNAMILRLMNGLQEVTDRLDTIAQHRSAVSTPEMQLWKVRCVHVG